MCSSRRPINRFFPEIHSRQTEKFEYGDRSFIGNGGVAERSNAADCKSALYEFDGSNPSPTTILKTLGKVRFFGGFSLFPTNVLFQIRVYSPLGILPSVCCASGIQAALYSYRSRGVLLIMAAQKPAPNPLSMLTTVMLGAQELSMVKSGAIPPKCDP